MKNPNNNLIKQPCSVLMIKILNNKLKLQINKLKKMKYINKNKSLIKINPMIQWLIICIFRAIKLKGIKKFKIKSINKCQIQYNIQMEL